MELLSLTGVLRHLFLFENGLLLLLSVSNLMVEPL